ncbi:MAG: carboxymuconolactone decarboxylase family protein [Thermoanaerobaculia bacterium]
MTLDQDLVDALRTDYREAQLSTADRAMLDYVARLTRDATTLGTADLDLLRREGFDDRAILQITALASWFNYINRIADALGVGTTGVPDAPPG